MGVMTTPVRVLRSRHEQFTEVPDAVAVESPLTIVHGSETVSTTMRTPGHDLELCAGWLVSESEVRQPDDIASMGAFRRVDEAEDVVRFSLAEHVSPPVPRAFITSASCGVCGSSEHRSRHVAPVQAVPGSWSSSAVASLPDVMRGEQRAFDRTGGLHAAALAVAPGEVLVVREDVGRHNAVDKVIGWALMQGRLPLVGAILVVSGRVSYEIVQKAWAAGLAGICAVSAPSSLAVEFAGTCGMFLAGMVRNGDMNVYAGRGLLIEWGAGSHD